MRILNEELIADLEAQEYLDSLSSTGLKANFIKKLQDNKVLKIPKTDETVSIFPKYRDILNKYSQIESIIRDSIISKGFDTSTNKFLNYIINNEFANKLSIQAASVLNNILSDKRYKVTSDSTWLKDRELYEGSDSDIIYRIQLNTYLDSANNRMLKNFDRNKLKDKGKYLPTNRLKQLSNTLIKNYVNDDKLSNFKQVLLKHNIKSNPGRYFSSIISRSSLNDKEKDTLKKVLSTVLKYEASRNAFYNSGKVRSDESNLVKELIDYLSNYYKQNRNNFVSDNENEQSVPSKNKQKLKAQMENTYKDLLGISVFQENKDAFNTIFEKGFEESKGNINKLQTYLDKALIDYYNEYRNK